MIRAFKLIYIFGLNVFFAIGQQPILSSEIAKSKLLKSAHEAQVTILMARLNNLLVKSNSIKMHLSLLKKQSISGENIKKLESLEEEYADLNKGFIEEKDFVHEKKINKDPAISQKIDLIAQQMDNLKSSLMTLNRKKEYKATTVSVLKSVEEKDVAHEFSLAKAHKASLIKEMEVAQKEIGVIRQKITRTQKTKGIDQEVVLAGLEQQILLLQSQFIHIQELARRYHMDKESFVKSNINNLTNEIESLNEEYNAKDQEIKREKLKSKDIKTAEKTHDKTLELVKKQKIQSVMGHVVSVVNDLGSINTEMVDINFIVGKEREISLAHIAPRIEKMKLDTVALDTLLISEKLNKDIRLMQNIDSMKKEIINLEERYLTLKEGGNISPQKKETKTSMKLATLSKSVPGKKKVLGKKDSRKKQVGENCNKNEECDSKTIKSAGGADINLVCYGWHCAYECQYDAKSHNYDKNKKCPNDWICNRPPAGYNNGYCSTKDLPEGSKCYSSRMCKKGLRCFNKDGECDIVVAAERKDDVCSGKCTSGAVHGGHCDEVHSKCQKGLSCVVAKKKRCDDDNICYEAIKYCVNIKAATQDC
ncbi:MAG TPA: hypothetical protein VJ201_01045 [Candidatus Babeliales bacterium]|nr:hypothetical protein [Candidatus Babeliales bacterium]